MRVIRLTTVLTHPVQYFAPWFRYIARECPELELTVVYATVPTPVQQGAGFDTSFEWDVPLLEGYQSVVVRPPKPEDDFRSGSFWGLDVPEIGLAVQTTKPDVVLVPGWYSVTLVRAIRACRRAGVPLLYRGDSILSGPPFGWRRMLRDLRTSYFLRQYAGYLCVGSLARNYLTYFGIREQDVFPSPHCIDNDFFAEFTSPRHFASLRDSHRQARGISNDEFVALFVGKVESQKRPGDLIHAAAALKDRVVVLMVGTGPDIQGCREEADALGARVVWEGFRNQTELGAAYASADCLVLPSQRETWGLVVNEALATGLPCIVSDAVGCAPDLIVPGETGATYPVGEVAALAEQLESLRAGLRAGRDFRSACRRKASEHSFERATAGLMAACEHVLARRSGSRDSADSARAESSERRKASAPS